MLKKLAVVLALAGASVLLLAAPAAGADDENSITYEGPYLLGAPGGEMAAAPSFRFVVTCDGDDCVAEWADAAFGSSPAAFTVQDPQFVSVREQSGSVCNGGANYVSETTLTMAATADRITGTVDFPTYSEYCPEIDVNSGRGAVTGVFDLPRVAGNPCILDREHPECVEAAASETPEAADPVDAAAPTEDSDADLNLPLVIGGVVLAVAAVGGGVAAVTSKLRSRVAPPGPSSSSPVSRRQVRVRRPSVGGGAPSTPATPATPDDVSTPTDRPTFSPELFEKAIDDYESSLPASEPRLDSETRLRMLNQLQSYVNDASAGQSPPSWLTTDFPGPDGPKP